MHAIRCKKTGEALADKLDGGVCACRSDRECVMHPEDYEKRAGRSKTVSLEHGYEVVEIEGIH